MWPIVTVTGVGAHGKKRGSIGFGLGVETQECCFLS